MTEKTKSRNWVDFKEIKQKVTMKMVLDYYGVFDALKPSGNNLVSCCPIHKGSNPRQFSVSLEKNLWHCFGRCNQGGNVIDFTAMMQYGNTDRPSIRKAGLLLKKIFLSEGKSAPRKKSPSTDNPNPPLRFQLALEPNHPYFSEIGLSPETIEHFGLGFCNKGLMKDRIAAPIHNQEGQLVAYCGLAITPEQIETQGLYKYPETFLKSEIVYNLHRQNQEKSELIVVNSALSVWQLCEAGFANSVALMEEPFSEAQEKAILNVLGVESRVILVTDADKDGIPWAEGWLPRLARKKPVRIMNLDAFLSSGT